MVAEQRHEALPDHARRTKNADSELLRHALV
jgi:hypothetical protein